MLKENLLFIREGFAQFEHTGSIFPTSKWAAEALANPLIARDTPKRILELGPGHGSVTTKILDNMVSGDTLFICEINPRLMRVLKRRLRRHPRFSELRRQIEFFCGPAQELPTDKQFDVIVCALPFLNFDLKTVQEIWEKIHAVSAQGSVLTYYEYIGIRPFSLFFSPPDRRKRMKELDVFFDALQKLHYIDRKPVWLNMLPIHIYRVELDRQQLAA